MATERKFTKAHPAVKPSHKGRLHKALGISGDKTIPLGRLNSAMQATKPANGFSAEHIRSMARYAKAMSHWG